jgi:hypothetical protein
MQLIALAPALALIGGSGALVVCLAVMLSAGSAAILVTPVVAVAVADRWRLGGKNQPVATHAAAQ